MRKNLFGLDEEDPNQDEQDLSDESDSADESPVDETPAPDAPDEPDENDEVDKELEDNEAMGENESEKKPLPQEIASRSNDMLKEMTPEEPAMPPVSANDQLSKYQNYINEYKKLQDQRSKGDLVNTLLAASGKIGQSMAGKYSGNFTPDQSGINMLQKMNERPVQDFEQRQVVQSRGMQLQGEMDSHDPNSPQSRLVRKYVEQRLGLVLDPNVSAADAQMLLKTVGRPVQTKYQKVNGTVTDPVTGEEKRISAIFDPGTGTYKDPNSGAALPGFLAEGLNPFQVVKGEHGEQELFNKSRGRAPKPINEANNFEPNAKPSEIYAQLRPEDRKYINDKITPAFQKATEKTRQRLTHVPVIMKRLQEAQVNPAALPQLKAEMARFDVGDQRLAVQEFNMFAQRQGYKGYSDWLQAHTQGTITPDFAKQMGHAVMSVDSSLRDELSKEAEKHADLLSKRLPKNVDPKLIAPLIYGGYKSSKKVVKKGYNEQTNQTELIYDDNSTEIVNGKR